MGEAVDSPDSVWHIGSVVDPSDTLGGASRFRLGG